MKRSKDDSDRDRERRRPPSPEERHVSVFLWLRFLGIWFNLCFFMFLKRGHKAPKEEPGYSSSSRRERDREGESSSSRRREGESSVSLLFLCLFSSSNDFFL